MPLYRDKIPLPHNFNTNLDKYALYYCHLDAESQTHQPFITNNRASLSIIKGIAITPMNYK